MVPPDLEALDRQAFIDLLAAGQADEVLLFMGHRPPRHGATPPADSAPDPGEARPGPWMLSQFFPAPFEVDGAVYPTAEHFMMAAKADLFGDRASRWQILATPDPALARRIGRQVTGFDESVWRQHRYPVVVQGNAARFYQNPPLGDYLLGTGDRILAEASPTDLIWGIGLGLCDPDAPDPARWRGLNLLGLALMRVRRHLRAATRPEPNLGPVPGR